MITLGVTAFAAFPPFVANAEAGGQSEVAVRHESIAEPIRPNEAGDYRLSCDRESDESR